MLMNTLDGLELTRDYPELAGKRVLVTGLTGSLGVELARSFADHQVSLVMHAVNDDAETQALAEIVAQSAVDVRLYTGAMTDADDIARMARSAAQCFGGLDAVVNMAEVVTPPAGATERDVERCVTGMLAMPCLVSRIAANRMNITHTAGSIINIVTERRGASAAERAVAGIARSAIASMTRTEAETLAPLGIRINAIAQAGARSIGQHCISGDPDVATLALHLACSRGHRLSGLVFEAAA